MIIRKQECQQEQPKRYAVEVLVKKIPNSQEVLLLSHSPSVSTHIMPRVSLYTPWKQKTYGFLMFSGDIDRDDDHEIDNGKEKFPSQFLRHFAVPSIKFLRKSHRLW